MPRLFVVHFADDADDYDDTDDDDNDDGASDDYDEFPQAVAKEDIGIRGIQWDSWECRESGESWDARPLLEIGRQEQTVFAHREQFSTMMRRQ